ncbi:hypothetical protein [Rubellicoccus peritrichatus]|uniref:Uncharacterized protein n=1 Tax=Rubellicoccus peritrichatus TaxID=3080537 RepID=A0AAQ3QVN5_9BACT|nr:hypothetical protein [Puniceicoccus sp. CR14]WOO43561.1 hypothetical protein RZN69_10720 [Puniceicoccus sp. CR14]
MKRKLTSNTFALLLLLGMPPLFVAYLYFSPFERFNSIDASKPFECSVSKPLIRVKDSFYFGAYGKLEQGGGYFQIIRKEGSRGYISHVSPGTFYANLMSDEKSPDKITIIWNPDEGTVGEFDLLLANGGAEFLIVKWGEKHIDYTNISQ